MNFFFSIVENLDIKRYEIGSDSINIDPTLKAILRYRKCSSIVAINGRYKDIPTRVINLFSDVLCNNFNNLIVS